DRERPGDQGRLLRAREGLLEGRPSDVQRAGVRFREDPADDQVDGRPDLIPPEGTQERSQERAFLQAYRRRLQFRAELRAARERSLFLGRRGHGESGPSEASGFNVSPEARVSVGPRQRYKTTRGPTITAPQTTRTTLSVSCGKTSKAAEMLQTADIRRGAPVPV